MQPITRNPSSVCLRRRWPAFGSTVEIRLWPHPGQVAPAALRLAQSVRFLKQSERRFSRFRETSELSRLNRRAGSPVRVSRPLYRLVTAAMQAAGATGGLFDPTVHRALCAAGYTRDFARLADGVVTGLRPMPAPGRFREVRLDPVRRTVTLPLGVGLDLGGIAKGWLADAVLRRLRPYGAAAVDLGGDVALTEPTPGAPPWLIEVADPRSDDRVLAEISLYRGGGVATSGTLRRRWRTEQGWQHHLIDPRTGRPARTDLAGATVAGPSAAAGEVLAKAVLLLGSTQGAAVLARFPQFAGLLVPHTGTPVRVGTWSVPQEMTS